MPQQAPMRDGARLGERRERTMTETFATNRCGRNGCRCLIGDGQTYCSPHCANATANTPLAAVDDRCGCGHAGCDHQHAATADLAAVFAAADEREL